MPFEQRMREKTFEFSAQRFKSELDAPLGGQAFGGIAEGEDFAGKGHVCKKARGGFDRHGYGIGPDLGFRLARAFEKSSGRDFAVFRREFRLRALRHSLGVGAQTGGHVDPQVFDVAFGHEGGERDFLFYAVEPEVGDPEVRMPGRLREEFRASAFGRAARDRTVTGEEAFDAERGMRGGRGAAENYAHEQRREPDPRRADRRHSGEPHRNLPRSPGSSLPTWRTHCRYPGCAVSMHSGFDPWDSPRNTTLLAAGRARPERLHLCHVRGSDLPRTQPRSVHRVIQRAARCEYLMTASPHERQIVGEYPGRDAARAARAPGGRGMDTAPSV